MTPHPEQTRESRDAGRGMREEECVKRNDVKRLVRRYRTTAGAWGATAGTWFVAIAVLLALGTATDRVVAQQQTSDALDVVQLRPNFYLIAGAGGNIVVQLGPDGAILVDS